MTTKEEIEVSNTAALSNVIPMRPSNEMTPDEFGRLSTRPKSRKREYLDEAELRAR